MNYKDINDKWKSFLFENTFKEDVIFNPEQEKKKKKRKKEKNAEKKIRLFRFWNESSVMKVMMAQSYYLQNATCI